MKRKTFLPPFCLVLLLLPAVSAHAQFECLSAGEITFAPMHPGPTDQITFNVRLIPGQVSPATSQILNKTVVTSGNNIEIDTVVTADASPFPGYAIADPTSSIATGLILSEGSLGPLAQGQYSVTATTGTYDSVTGTLAHLCGGPWYATLVVSSQPAPTQTGEVVEFRNASLDRYFITQNLQEIAALDSGQIKGWSRTGLHFSAYLPGLSDGRGVPITRVYRASSIGHLFTFIYFESEYAVGPDWQVESLDAFEIPVPSVLSGECAGGTMPVYRLWDGRSDADHRYTTDRGVRDETIHAGFIAEGFGPDSVFFCAIAP
ncbi:MAG: hypothetical protein ACREMY_08300 [bacterium]